MITRRAERYDEGSGEPSDESLFRALRDGDDRAYGLLWERHAPAARRAARAITSTFDPDDIVSESFAAVLGAIRAGGGPTEAFRPYLFATIRNVAAAWGRRPRPLSLDAMPEGLRADGAADPFETMSERSLIAQVFKSLPARHRTLLWYLEVEGMKPREIAPLMGLTPNAVSALSYRAREGFRRAWLAAYIAEPGRAAECRWFCERVVLPGGRKLGSPEAIRFSRHLRACRACQVIAADVVSVSQRLRAVVLPVVLGGTAATAYLAGATDHAAAFAPVGRRESPAPDAPAREGITSVRRLSDAVRRGSRITGRAGSPLRAAVLTTGAAAVAGALGVSIALVLSLAQEPAEQPTAGAVPSAPDALIPPASSPAVTETPVEPATPDEPESPADPPVAEPPVAADPPVATDPAARSPQPPAAPPVGALPGSPGSDPEPTAPPSTPIVGGPPSPTPSPDGETAEPPAPAPFAFTNGMESDATVPDMLAGVGTPGARVVLLDDVGATLAETTVAADGTFAADVSGPELHQGMTIHAEHTPTEAGSVPTTTVLGPLTFAEPSVSLSDDADVPSGQAAAPGSGPRPTVIRVAGVAGTWVVITFADQVALLHLVEGDFDGMLFDLRPGSNRVTAQYVDPLTGRGGIIVERHIVSSAGVGPGDRDRPL
jgi:RNA polymerase sigma factor (sigma-70 family)